MRRTPQWSERRQRDANLVASILYGVIAVMTAAVAADPGELTYAEVAVGALIVGFVMALTRFVVETADRETELGRHLPLAELGTVVWRSSLVLVFPALAALFAVASAIFGIAWRTILNIVLYLGVASVFLLGVGSRYVLDNRLGPALAPGSAGCC